MISNQVVFKIKKGDRDYILSLAPDSPLGELFDVITQIRAEVMMRMEASIKEEEVKKEG